MKAEVIDRFFQRLLIALFFVIIAVPALKMGFGEKIEFSYTEKRALAAFPEIPEDPSQIRQFFSGLDDYLNDHFGFREWMIYRYQREMKKRFGGSQASTKLLKGVDDWYFNTDNRLLEDFTGRNLLSESDLNRWILSYRNKKTWLADRGIRYLFIVPPNKQTIYGDFVGTPLTDHRGPSRFDQIKDALSASDRATLVDPAAALLQNPDSVPLFFKSDTHWTPHGAYLAYQVIAERIESLFPGIEFRDDFRFTGPITRSCDSTRRNCGDLTNMLLDFDSFEESFRDVKPFVKCARKAALDFLPHDATSANKERYFSTSCPSAQLKAVVFFDSFFVAIEPYFSENFKHAIYLLKEYDQRDVEMLLETFKPDIVIEERVERHLW